MMKYTWPGAVLFSCAFLLLYVIPSSLYASQRALSLAGIPKQQTLIAAIAKPTTAIPSRTASIYAGIPVGLTEAGDPYVGDPAAPITLHEYSDLLCPFCKRHFEQTYPVLLDKYVRSGQVRFVFHQFPIVNLHPTAAIAAAATLCVAQQNPAAFWVMHDQLLLQQEHWRPLTNPRAYLAKLASEVGASLQRYQRCMADDQVHSTVQQKVTAGAALGFNATPSFQIDPAGDQPTAQLVGALPADTFVQWFDALIAGKELPKAVEPPKAELPFWAQPAGLAPDPNRPGYTMAGDPFKGATDATITIVEFSDFACPACATHALTVQPTLDQTLIDQGRVRWVFKHFPLREHTHAPLLAVAAECAAQQESFWSMHDQIFTLPERWLTEPTADAVETQLMELAAQLLLDQQQFQQCLGGREAMAAVLRDLQDGQGIIQQTPTFIVLSQDSGTLIKGSRPAPEFITLLHSFMAQSKKGEATAQAKLAAATRLEP